MNDESFFSRPFAAIPFRLRVRAGRIAVFYRPNADPLWAGFDILAGLDFNLHLCRGYPVIYARIEDYAGSGYRAVCGWLQFMTRAEKDSHNPDMACTTILFRAMSPRLSRTIPALCLFR
jgi:hypothetical protein